MNAADDDVNNHITHYHDDGQSTFFFTDRDRRVVGLSPIGPSRDGLVLRGDHITSAAHRRWLEQRFPSVRFMATDTDFYMSLNQADSVLLELLADRCSIYDK